MRNLHLILSYVLSVKSKVEISQNFVTFSEYMNFTKGQCISKATFLETSLPQKLTEILDKILGQSFVKYFVGFWGNGVARKNAFEIY